MSDINLIEDKIKTLTELYKNGNFKDLVNESKDFLDNVNKNSAQIWNFYALGHKALGNYEHAKEIYKNLIKNNPDNVLLLSNLANVYGGLGQIDKQIKIYSEVLEKDNSMVEIYNNLGLAYTANNDFNNAIKAFGKLLNENPKHSHANYNLGNVYRKIGQHKLAIKYLSLTDISLAKSHKIEILYQHASKEEFDEFYSLLMDQEHIDPLFGSVVSHANLRFDDNYNNPFCSDSLSCIYKNQVIDVNDDKKLVNEVLDYVFSQKSDFIPQDLLINGKETYGNIFNNKEVVAFQKIKKIIYKEIEKYRTYYNKSNEIFLRKFPKNFEIIGWMISMDKGGSLKAHIHKEGWVSGSLYFKLPEKRNGNSGNIAFSQHGEHYPNIDNYRTEILNLNEGDICMFPSSLFHYTIPYQSDEKRVCLAFDLKPIN
ncbi:MAG: hypothetical protein CMD06_00760 [Flavobacteriales bacterium]|nr:hypothetical protein [Flavobacteriales bacterium]|tara:strand:+ start:2747 stop:4024 length:1278 start_codon:yes stop_codon:yes gene_type:complete